MYEQDVAALIEQLTRKARFRTGHCIPLSIELQKNAPEHLSELQRAALEAVAARAQEVAAVEVERQRRGPANLAEPRRSVITAWSTLQTILTALSGLPSSLPTGAEAARLRVVLFPSGLDFASHDAAAVWSESKRLLGRIDDEGLAGQVETLAHPDVLRAIREAQTALGVATGLGLPEASPPEKSLREALDRFAFAVSRYARALSIEVDDRDYDAAARFARALHPIDTYRITSARSDDEAEDPAAPEPTSGPGGPTPPPF